MVFITQPVLHFDLERTPFYTVIPFLFSLVGKLF